MSKVENSNCGNDIDMLEFMANASMIFSGFAMKSLAIESKVQALEDRVEQLQRSGKNTWVTLSVIAKMHDLSRDALRKRLQNGDFEEGVDFKWDGNRIVVRQEAVIRLQRQRRRSNGQN